MARLVILVLALHCLLFSFRHLAAHLMGAQAVASFSYR
jgi:hypothetical protein